MPKNHKIRVALNGYGVIGRRVADAIQIQRDMQLVGIADVSADSRVRMAARAGMPLFGSTGDGIADMKKEGLTVAGSLDDLLKQAEIVVDCTPKSRGAESVKRYRDHRVKFVLQGGEEHEVTGHSFSAESNYETTVGRDSTRVVSCNTTSVVRTLTALKRAGVLKYARGTLLRRATDPWKSHQKGILNTILPEDEIPSHQGPDAQSIDPELDVVTMAAMVPETVGHVHYWYVKLNHPIRREDALGAFERSSRIARIRAEDGFTGINTVKEYMLDMGRPHGNLYEVALWENLVEVKGDELFYAYMVDNQAIVIPETVDAVRALAGRIKDPRESIAMTNASLGIGGI